MSCIKLVNDSIDSIREAFALQRHVEIDHDEVSLKDCVVCRSFRAKNLARQRRFRNKNRGLK